MLLRWQSSSWCKSGEKEEKTPAVERGGRRFFRQANSRIFRKKSLTIHRLYYIIGKLSGRDGRRIEYAAIAQSVERILGKDEVASSNLASSSKTSEIFGFQRFSFYIQRFYVRTQRNVRSVLEHDIRLCQQRPVHPAIRRVVVDDAAGLQMGKYGDGTQILEATLF